MKVKDWILRAAVFVSAFALGNHEPLWADVAGPTNLSFTAIANAEALGYTRTGEIKYRERWTVTVHVNGARWKIVPLLDVQSRNTQPLETVSLKTPDGIAIIYEKDGNKYVTVTSDTPFAPVPSIAAVMAWAGLIPKVKSDHALREFFISGLAVDVDERQLDLESSIEVSFSQRTTMPTMEFVVLSEVPVFEGRRVPISIVEGFSSQTKVADRVTASLFVSGYQTNRDLVVPKNMEFTRFWVDAAHQSFDRPRPSTGIKIKSAHLTIHTLETPCRESLTNAPVGTFFVSDQRLKEQFPGVEPRYRLTNKFFEPTNSPVVLRALKDAVPTAGP